MEENNLEQEQVEIDETTEVEVNQDNGDNETVSILKRLENILTGSKKDTKETQEDNNDDTDNDNLITVSADELDRLIEEKTQAKVDKLAAKTKRKADTEARVDNAIAKVDPKYKDFIMHKAQEDNFNIDEYLKENPQYAITKSNTVIGTTSNIKLSDSKESYAAFLGIE